MADPGVTELYKFAVLSEEVGEVARELNETSEFGAGAPNDDSALAAELVQVAAVCVAWLESIANRNGGELP
jgi:NTP pyrophosphatase (non-canonical NTP hydrolase)